MKALLSRIAGLTLLLLIVGACVSCSPKEGVQIGKDREVTKPATTFDAHDTLYAIAAFKDPPQGARIAGRLVIINAEGQKPGPVRGFDMTIELLPDENKANFNFPAPAAGWPNGKYRFEAVLLDASGKEKLKKSVEFATAGNQPPKRAAAATKT